MYPSPLSTARDYPVANDNTSDAHTLADMDMIIDLIEFIYDRMSTRCKLPEYMQYRRLRQESKDRMSVESREQVLQMLAAFSQDNEIDGYWI